MQDRSLTESLIAGVDEAGRGPLAGPVYAAAVILDPSRPINGLTDSKKLTARRREQLFDTIRQQALSWSVARAEVDEIDTLNIFQAAMLAMQRAIAGLAITPKRALIDGNHCPALVCPSEAIIKGDATVAAISAASILAKVERDRYMVELHQQFPDYGFDRHKGYPTAEHRTVLMKLGASPVHRRSFAPVQAALIFKGN